MSEKQTSIETLTTPKVPILKSIMIAAGAIIFLTLLGFMISPKEETYTPIYPAAFAKYQALKDNLCVALKEKGSAKLLDDANGHQPIYDTDTGFDRNLTAKYRDMDCAKVQIEEVVIFSEESNLK